MQKVDNIRVKLSDHKALIKKTKNIPQLWKKLKIWFILLSNWFTDKVQIINYLDLYDHVNIRNNAYCLLRAYSI